MASRCKSCPVSLVCMAGQLKSKILLYCAVCEHLEIERAENVGTFRSQIGDRIPCDREDANDMLVTLSVCSDCSMRRTRESIATSRRMQRWKENNRDR